MALQVGDGQCAFVHRDRVLAGGEIVETVISLGVGSGGDGLPRAVAQVHAGRRRQADRHARQALARVRLAVVVDVVEDGVADGVVGVEAGVEVGGVGVAWQCYRYLVGRRVQVTVAGVVAALVLRRRRVVGRLFEAQTVVTGRQVFECVAAVGVCGDDVRSARLGRVVNRLTVFVQQVNAHAGDARLSGVLHAVAVAVFPDEVADGAGVDRYADVVRTYRQREFVGAGPGVVGIDVVFQVPLLIGIGSRRRFEGHAACRAVTHGVVAADAHRGYLGVVETASGGGTGGGALAPDASREHVRAVLGVEVDGGWVVVGEVVVLGVVAAAALAAAVAIQLHRNEVEDAVEAGRWVTR